MEMEVTVLGGTLRVDVPVTPPEPQPPQPPHNGGSGMFKPDNMMEFHDEVQRALDKGYFVLMDPETNLEMVEPIEFNVHNIGAPHGIMGNGAKFSWKGAGGVDMFTFRGRSTAGVNTGLMIDNLYMSGGGYDRAPAGACLKLYAPDGDAGAIYKFVLRNVYTTYATRGVVLEGAVFEGHMDNIHAENHNSHGMEFLHTNLNAGNRGVVSNISIVHPNLSRNYGAGLKCTYSTNIMYGSFVLNALGGVFAPDGLRYAAACNGENTGESLFTLGSNGYGSVITGCEASSNAETVARKYEGGQWVDKGKPMLYLLDGPADQTHNHCSYYGTGSDPMRVVK